MTHQSFKKLYVNNHIIFSSIITWIQFFIFYFINSIVTIGLVKSCTLDVFVENTGNNLSFQYYSSVIRGWIIK